MREYFLCRNIREQSHTDVFSEACLPPPPPPPRKSPQWARVSLFTRLLDQTQRRTTVGRTPMDERSPRRRDLYLTTHNTHNRETSMPPVGFEPKISVGERPQTYALECAATGTGEVCLLDCLYMSNTACKCNVITM
jgi:hypothetical protein